MARIELKGVAHSYGEHPSDEAGWALKELDHVWSDGEAYALLGPSGCGKTTLLNIISGLVSPTVGRVLFDGCDVTDLPTETRNIAQVFQFPVVYETMTVYDNLAFPLRNRGEAEDVVRERVNRVAGMLELEAHLQRRAGDLEADLRQTISMGRGLVRTDVAAILFDEPLTVIDPNRKNGLRRRLEEIHRETGLTLVYVTHDQTEALTFADRVVVMHEGEVVQVGTPEELYERPSHTFVGYFVGNPGMNFLPCGLDGDAVVVDGHRIPVTGLPTTAAGPDDRLELGIRPGYLRVVFERPDDGLPAKITGVEDLGSSKIVTAETSGGTVKARMGEDEAVRADSAWLAFPPAKTLLYRNSRLVGA